MNKCLGCGSFLQTECKDKEGYIREENETLCERCFRIQHYNEYKIVSKGNEEYLSILKRINETNDLVVLVVDIFNMDVSFFRKYLENPILLVLTKRDLLKDVYEEALLQYIELDNIVDRVMISSKKNYHFDLLFQKIEKYRKGKHVYVVGLTNAGKSTMINKILYDYTEYLPHITTSMIPSTTLNVIEVKVDDQLTLYDTPGLLDEGNLIFYVEKERIKKIVPNKKIKPITYQVSEKQYFYIEDLFKVEVEQGDITFYISNCLSLERKYKDIKDTALYPYQQSFCISSKRDIVLKGLGFLSCRKGKITIFSKYPVSIEERKSIFK